MRSKHAGPVSAHVRVLIGAGKVVVDLAGVWHGRQGLANIGQSSGDEVGGALLPEAKHH